MNKIELRYCKSTYVDKLYRELLISQDPSGYFQDHFDIDNNFCGSTGIYVPDELSLDPKHSDYENSIKIYTYLKDLTEVQASDERFWTYLTHTVFWRYMRERWPAEKAENPLNRIKDRYFMRSLTLRGLTRNGISRLWWYAHLTLGKDLRNTNLLQLLLSKQDLVVGITERAIGANEKVRTAILEYLEENPAITNSEDARRNLFVNINLLGGVKILPFLEKQEIKNHLYKLQ